MIHHYKTMSVILLHKPDLPVSPSPYSAIESVSDSIGFFTSLPRLSLFAPSSLEKRAMDKFLPPQCKSIKILQPGKITAKQ